MLPDVPYVPSVRANWSPAHEDAMRAWIIAHMPTNAREALLGLLDATSIASKKTPAKFVVRALSQTCRKCKQVIQWEQLGGMRLMHPVQRRSGENLIVYRTRCGCGDVNRDNKGRKIR
jgi:hypothetical protein